MTASIHAIRYHLPERRLTNEALAAEFPDTTPDTLHKTSGVKTRHIAGDDETPSDLAFQAAEKLFNDYPDARKKIDALIYCTEGLDYKAPLTACILHQRLGLSPGCLSLDIPGGCTGFVNALLVAKSLLASNHQIHNILLITAEAVSKVLHPDDLHLRMMFGDGACATLIGRSETHRIGQFVTGTDGSGKHALWVECSGFRQPADGAWLEQHRDTPNRMKYGRLVMQGDALLHFSLVRVPGLIKDTLTANDLNENDIDLFIFHQASHIILKSLKRKCRIPDQKFFVCLEESGNTVSSTIPIALHEAQQRGRIASGAKVMLVGFGVGLSWAATVIEVS